jgi:hypothetical protein
MSRPSSSVTTAYRVCSVSAMITITAVIVAAPSR